MRVVMDAGVPSVREQVTDRAVLDGKAAVAN
jgi:hypothetical protein